MQTILCLIKNNRVLPVNDTFANFLTTMSWQTVHEQIIRLGTLRKLLIYLIILERIFARLLLFLKAHTSPNVRVDYICILNGSLRITYHFDNCSSSFGDFLCIHHNLRIRLITFRTSHRYMNTKFCSADHKGMSHIVAIADISQLEPLQLTFILINSLKISKHLTRMRQIAKTVNDWNRCITSQVYDFIVAERTNHNAIKVTGHYASCICYRLTASKLNIIFAQKQSVTAKLICAYFKRNPRTSR
ncbi:hypothetical protein D3C78_737880 [compost metagenome]